MVVTFLSGIGIAAINPVFGAAYVRAIPEAPAGAVIRIVARRRSPGFHSAVAGGRAGQNLGLLPR